MPLFSSTPRKRKQSPSRVASSNNSNTLEANTPLRSRRQNNSNGSLLPMTQADTRKKKGPRGASNNFLLGGMYVSTKQRRRKQARSGSGGSQTTILMGLLLGGGILLYGIIVFLRLPPRDALLRTLESYHLPPMQQERGTVENLFMERMRQNKSKRMAILKRFIPEWFHRNTILQQKKIATAPLVQPPVMAPTTTEKETAVHPKPPTLLEDTKETVVNPKPPEAVVNPKPPNVLDSSEQTGVNPKPPTLVDTTETVVNPKPPETVVNPKPPDVLDSTETVAVNPKPPDHLDSTETLVNPKPPDLLDTTKNIVNPKPPDLLDATETVVNPKPPSLFENGGNPSPVVFIPILTPQHITKPATSPRVPRTLHSPEETAISSCPSIEESISITLVIQSSWDRVWIVEETCTARWKTDAILLVVAVPHDHDNNETVEWTHKCPHVRILYHRLDNDDSYYPVNLLRNVALEAVQTSHVLVVDVDFVPSVDLDAKIRTALQANHHATTTKHALVIPAFQRVAPCTSEQTCREQFHSSFLPRTFTELETCYHKKECIVFQSDVNWEGHSSTRSEDWLQRKWDTEATLSCFDSLRYEPYVVIRWCPADSKDKQPPHPVAPYYDERFMGYGKNKIQYIFHLRMMAYQFSVLAHDGFIVHTPHVESSTKKTWNNLQHSTLHYEMDQLYETFLHELVKKYYQQYGRDMIDQCETKKHKKHHHQ